MTPHKAPDELRQRLRALGYLNAPVDRFVLGGADERRSNIALAASASARIGLIAGFLLGPAGAAGLHSKLPELITSASDALVIALYLAAMFGITAAIAAFAVIVPASWIAERANVRSAGAFPSRARRAAAAAGVLIFLACLAYLTLWWRAAVTTSTTFAGPTPLFSAAVLAVAVAISLVLGHAVAVTALAVVARVRRSADGMTPDVPLSAFLSVRATVALAIVAFAGAAALLFASASGAARTPASPALTVVPTGERVLVIAIDGLDVALLDRLRSASPASLPSFSRVLGGSSATLASDADRDPARVWTTIATGQPPEKHGINALEGRQLAGVEGRLRAGSGAGALLAGATDLLRLTKPAIASGNERRIPTFWEVAARAGLRTSVIHWWATWPAATTGDDAGTVLSDRALLRLEQGGALDGEIAPATLYDALRKDWPARHARAGERAKNAAAPGSAGEIASLVTRSAELDAMIADLAVDPRVGDVDLEVVYLPGLDIAQHGLLSADQAASSPSVIAARVQAVERYYAFLDGLVGDIINASSRTVLLVTEPGRIASPGDGLAALSGPPANSGSARANGQPVSIAATVLSLLGVPVAADLSGAPLSNLESEEFRRAHPDRSVTTYGARRVIARTRAGKALDQEMIERMRSLGYVR